MDKLLIAVDLGNKQTKIKTEKETLVYPSKLALVSFLGQSNADFGATLRSQDPNALHKYQLTNDSTDSYMWGEDLTTLHQDNAIQETIHEADNRYTQTLFKALANFALARAIKPYVDDPDKKVVADVITGLPTNEYVTSDSPSYKALVKLLKGEHSVKIDDQTYNFRIDKITLLPQPCGTLYDKLLDENGRIQDQELMTDKVRIIDVGGGTILLNEFNNVELNADIINSPFTGAQSLYHMLEKHYGSFKPERIERALRERQANNGRVLYHINKRDTRDITEEANKAIAAWDQQIIYTINSQFANENDYDRTIFTGGGMNLMDKDQISDKIHNADFVSNGEIANVEGYFKFLTLKNQKD